MELSYLLPIASKSPEVISIFIITRRRSHLRTDGYTHQNPLLTSCHLPGQVRRSNPRNSVQEFCLAKTSATAKSTSRSCSAHPPRDQRPCVRVTTPVATQPDTPLCMTCRWRSISKPSSLERATASLLNHLSIWAFAQFAALRRMFGVMPPFLPLLIV